MIVNGAELINRLVACGFTVSNATDACFRYAAEGDFSGLERFIREQEQAYDDWREYV